MPTEFLQTRLDFAAEGKRSALSLHWWHGVSRKEV